MSGGASFGGATAGDGGAPTATASAGSTASAGATHESHTRNFEVDHVTEKRTVSGGVLRRLTVAVVIDGAPTTVGGPVRSKEEIERIAGLVRSAVGFDEKRGDAVTVEAVPFLVSEAAPAPPPPAASFPMALPATPKKAAPYVGAVFVVLVIVLTLAVRSRRRKKVVATTLALAAAKEKASAEAVIVEILGPETKKTESPDDLRRLVRERAALDPATAALVVRSWLGSTEATRDEAA